MDNFLKYLKTHPDMDCDLIIGDCDMPATFVWGDSLAITQEGYEQFKPIMEAPYKVLSNGNIEIFCKNYKIGEKFTMAAAGYVSESLYNKWFEGEWCKEANDDKPSDCLHTNTEVVKELGNGYFRLKCKDCKHEFVDG